MDQIKYKLGGQEKTITPTWEKYKAFEQEIGGYLIELATKRIPEARFSVATDMVGFYYQYQNESMSRQEIYQHIRKDGFDFHCAQFVGLIDAILNLAVDEEDISEGKN